MKEFIKKFVNAAAADNYAITHIPFTTSIATNPIQNLVCNKTGKHLENDNGIVIICPPDIVVPNEDYLNFSANLPNTKVRLVLYSDYGAEPSTPIDIDYSFDRINWTHLP